jgi:UDP-N-acetylglucosamine 4,6-dehydratase
MHGGEVFVPKIPSMRIVDLAKLIAPEAEIKITGIRPGEKLHEVLVSEDEARHARELDDMFIVQPAHPWWRSENWVGAKSLADNFRYASDTNSQWLTVGEMQNLIHEQS